MDGIGNEIDAGFFQLIHQLVNAPHPSEEEDREVHRRGFECFQRIAPWDGKRFPEDSEFSVVRCNDLARKGFSFLSAREPDFKQLVAAFTSPGETVYLAARIVRVEPVLFCASGRVERVAGTPEAPGDAGRVRMFLSGCRFTRRLHKPADRP